jgi:hypothetical protein
VPKKGVKLVVTQEPEYRAPAVPPVKAPPGVICAPHRARMGVAVQADILINGEPFCKTCYRGQGPIVSTQFFTQKPVAARSQNVKVSRAMRSDIQQGRCQSASP